METTTRTDINMSLGGDGQGAAPTAALPPVPAAAAAAAAMPLPDPATLDDAVEDVFVTTGSHVATTDWEISYAPDAVVLVTNRSRDDFFKARHRACHAPLTLSPAHAALTAHTLMHGVGGARRPAGAHEGLPGVHFAHAYSPGRRHRQGPPSMHPARHTWTYTHKEEY
jgi:hypothetical protein